MSVQITLKHPHETLLLKHAEYIAKHENIKINTNELKKMIKNAENSVIIVLNGLHFGLGSTHEIDRMYDYYQAYKFIVQPETKVNFEKKCTYFSLDPGTIPIIVQENYVDWGLTKKELYLVSESMANGDIFNKKMFLSNISKNIVIDMYACQSAIFHYPKKIKKEPRFGLIWTKQSAMYQKKKYYNNVESFLNKPVNVINLFRQSDYLKHLMVQPNDENNHVKTFMKNYNYDVSLSFDLYNSFNTLSPIKGITKKSFYTKYS
jgi:hypothetical protein